MDAKSFIRTFENVFDQLAEMRIQVQEQCEELENACYKAEMQHRKNVIDLTSSFDVRLDLSPELPALRRLIICFSECVPLI
jgi:hypothetical protein